MGAREYYEKFSSKKISPFDICLSFDDGLKCQYDVAKPILEEFQLDRFFFINTGRFTNDTDMLEIFRYFRTNFFNGIENFYSKYFKIIEQQKIINLDKEWTKFTKSNYLKEYEFYSENDRFFRYIRDKSLQKEEYYFLMKLLMNSHSLRYRKINCQTLHESR